MSINLFETRRMVRALLQSVPLTTFFLDTFFGEEDVSEAETVDIDIDRGGEARMAPFVSSLLEGKVVQRRGYKTNSYKPPYVKPKMVTTAEMLLNRSMGENIYVEKSAEVRAGEQLGKDLAEMDYMVTRREEWMAAMGLQTGQVICQGDGINDTIDFDMLPSHLPILTGTKLWSDHTNSTPITDISDYSELVSKDSGLACTDVILGSSAKNHFMKNTAEVLGEKSLFNHRQIDIGAIKPQMLAKGVKYIGHLNESGVDVWTYSGRYFNDLDQKSYELMHPNKVLFGCRGARCVRHYGAIKDLRALVALKRFPKSWVVEDPSARFVSVQSAPLMAPHQIDGFLCATVI